MAQDFHTAAPRRIASTHGRKRGPSDDGTHRAVMDPGKLRASLIAAGIIRPRSDGITPVVANGAVLSLTDDDRETARKHMAKGPIERVVNQQWREAA